MHKYITKIGVDLNEENPIISGKSVNIIQRHYLIIKTDKISRRREKWAEGRKTKEIAATIEEKETKK